MNTIRLSGCRTEPLLSYLAGLGVVRIVAEQVDPHVSAQWDGEELVIDSSLNEKALSDFFMCHYRPTPVISPWNGRGGFQEGKQRPSEKIVEKVENSCSERLSPYRNTIGAARKAWAIAGDLANPLITEGKISAKHKAAFIELCRAHFPDEALAWLDTSVVLLDDKPAYPLILGTGGNFGSMDISINFLQNLEEVGLLLDEQSDTTRRDDDKHSNAQSLLRHALFRHSEVRLSQKSTGQYDPGRRGLCNSWSFVLAVEGALVFASSTARRLSRESQTGGSKASMPFTVDSTSVGYASASEGEKPKGELWVPLWRDSMSYQEIRLFVSEGRSQWGRSQAKSGLDFIRATATLGVDRSVDEFVRYLVSERLGQSMFAVPVGRFKVRDSVLPEADILRQLDDWMNRIGSNNSPATVAAALHAINRAQFEVATSGGPRPLQRLLAAFADAEQAVSRSPRFRKSSGIPPIEGLQAQEWLPLLNDRSAEFRVAVGLASLRDRVGRGSPVGVNAHGMSLASLLRPVDPVDRTSKSKGWDWAIRGPRIPNLGHRPLFDILKDVMGARAVFAASKPASATSGWSTENKGSVIGLPFAYDSAVTVDIADVGRLLSGRLKEKKLATILSGLLLLDWYSGQANSEMEKPFKCPYDPTARMHTANFPVYVVLAPFFAGFLPAAPTIFEPNTERCDLIRPRTEWIGAIRSGAIHIAARSAAQLLRARGWELISDDFERTNTNHKLLVAALLLHVGCRPFKDIRFMLNKQSAFKFSKLDDEKDAKAER